MKKIIFLVFFFSIFTSLHAYSKKVVFSTFSNSKNAQKSLQEFNKTATYKEMDILSKKYGFKIYTRESGKYFIVVAEPLNSKEILKKVYGLAQIEYKDTYYINTEIVQTSSVKETNKLELESKVAQKVENKKLESKSTVAKKNENISKDSIEKIEEFSISILDSLLYFTILIILAVLIFFYRKFKRIYDQY